MDEMQNLIFEFSFTDGYGQTISYKRDLSQDSVVEDDITLQLEQFKYFLLAQGYLPEQVEKIINTND